MSNFASEAGPALQRRTVLVLSIGQVLGGLGVGATLSLGALLAEAVSGNAALSGLAATMSTLGAAVASIPLARLAARRGRRIALALGAAIAALGAVVVVFSVIIDVFLLLLVGMGMLGSSVAVGLQSRFAATDLAAPDRRGRDLSLVVWTTTIGVVIGPNLLAPGEALGAALGMPQYTGAFVFAIICQIAAVVLFLTMLRPDPLLTAVAIGLKEAPPEPGRAPVAARGILAILREHPTAATAMLAIALSHMSMVSVMAMTPLHITEHGGTVALVGFTISLHTAGMFGLSPVFGILSDKLGRPAVILLGQALLALALVTNWLGQEEHVFVAIALALIGLGWSASTVAGSAMLTESVDLLERPKVQGVSDTTMNLCGAVGGALAGVVMAGFGYGLLNAFVLALVAVVVLTLIMRPRVAVPA
ncbi:MULTISPECIES: MFS transporter [unclassified Diaminobutyricimonas]|uniref:MFS transporter n=1 Tax=unclassified Diaminobutyricimonas TaxID=2643261 RepID=UPI001E5E8BF8|nr:MULTISPECIES: MFS transporter [unclassified Diaminobutyricimonas]